MDDQLDWTFHTNKIITKLRSANYILAKVKNKYPLSARLAVYTCLVPSHLTWGTSVTGAITQTNINRLEAEQNKAIRNMTGTKYNCHTTPLYHKFGLLKAADLIHAAKALPAYKFRKDLLPHSLNTQFRYSYESGDRSQRENALNLHVPNTTGQGRELFPLPEITKAWKRLPYHLKSLPSITQYKKTA